VQQLQSLSRERNAVGRLSGSYLNLVATTPHFDETKSTIFIPRSTTPLPDRQKRTAFCRPSMMEAKRTQCVL
jgi:hypothetical protein